MDLPRSELAEVSPPELRSGTRFDLRSLTGLGLAGADLAGKTFATCLVQRCVLTKADLRNATFDETAFEDCDLSSALLGGATLTDVTFRRCKLLGVDWSGTRRSIIGAPLRFESCQLDFGVFQKLNLRGSVFRDCSAREVDLAGADLREASFTGTNLERARFGGTTLADADLVSAYAYDLDPRENDVRGLRVALPEGAALLRHFGVVVVSG